MYTPKNFQNTNTEEVKNFIRQNGFATVVSQGDKLLATHTPLELSPDGTILSGHIAKANPQTKALKEGSEVLAIFQGPHTYISSSWYNHENVPTWNYIAAHVYGKIKIIEGENLYKALKELTDRYEQRSLHPVSVENLSPAYLQSQMRGVFGFEIHITSIEASYKLSQNRDEVNHTNIIKELEKRGDANDVAIAGEMKKRFK